MTRSFCSCHASSKAARQRGQTLGCPVSRLPELGDLGLGLPASVLCLRRCARLEPLDRGIPVVQLRLDRVRERRRVVGHLRGQAVLGDRDVDLEVPELSRRPPRPSRGRLPGPMLPPRAACRACPGDALASRDAPLSARASSSSMCRRISAHVSSIVFVATRASCRRRMYSTTSSLSRAAANALPPATPSLPLCGGRAMRRYGVRAVSASVDMAALSPGRPRSSRPARAAVPGSSASARNRLSRASCGRCLSDHSSALR